MALQLTEEQKKQWTEYITKYRAGLSEADKKRREFVKRVESAKKSDSGSE